MTRPGGQRYRRRWIRRSRPRGARFFLPGVTMLWAGAVMAFLPIASIHAEPLPSVAFGLLWRYIPGGTTIGPIVGGPAGSVYFQADDWYLYRIDSDGKRAFRFDMRVKPGPGLAPGPDGAVIASTATGAIVCVSRTGQEVWRRSAGTGNAALVGGGLARLDNGLIFAAYRPGTLVCIGPSGNTLWKLSFTAKIESFSTVRGGGLLVADSAARLYRFDSWGNVEWTASCGSPIVSAAQGDRVTYAAEKNGYLDAIGADGTVLWRHRLGEGAEYSTRPQIIVNSSGDAVVVGADGKLYCVRADGSERYAAFIPNTRFTGCAEGYGGITYASTDTGLIVGLGADGAARLSVRTPEPADLGPMYAASPRLAVSAARSWVVYAYRLLGAFPASARAENSSPETSGREVRVTPAGNVPAPLAMFADAAGMDSADYVSLRSRIDSPFATDRQDAIAEIRRRIDAGRLRGSLSYIVEILARAAAAPDVGGAVRDLSLRMDATQLLGEVAYGPVKSFLIWLARTSSSPEIVSSAVRALSKTGGDADSSIRRALLDVVARQDPSVPDERVGRAVIACLEQIRVYSGSVGEAGARVINEFLTKQYPDELRASAIRLLR